MDIPDLLEIQKEAFETFLQKYIYPDKEDKTDRGRHAHRWF